MNQPLPPTEQAKVFFFFLLLSLMIPFGVGVLLLLVTLWGLYRMRSTQEFSYMETVRIIHKVFAAIASIGFTLIFMINSEKFGDIVGLLIIIISMLIYPVYSFLLNTLFYTPLSKHKEWVVANGIFSTTPLISFGKTASIADELIKLNNLKEANLITVDEFNALRSKLLS